MAVVTVVLFDLLAGIALYSLIIYLLRQTVHGQPSAVRVHARRADRR